MVAERQPQILLIDEIDKMNVADTAALLTMMEGGRLVRTKKGRELNISNPLWVIAASNRMDGLSPELRSRFAIRQLKPYDRAEFLTVVRGVLMRRESLSSELADEIAMKLDGLSQNVRDAIRVARLAPRLGVDKAWSCYWRDKDDKAGCGWQGVTPGDVWCKFQKQGRVFAACVCASSKKSVSAGKSAEWRYTECLNARNADGSSRALRPWVGT
jgi:hypothetical protein